MGCADGGPQRTMMGILVPIILLVGIVVPMLSMPIHRLGGGVFCHIFSAKTMFPSGCGADAPPSPFAFTIVATMARAERGTTVKGGRGGDTGMGPYRPESHYHSSFSSLPFLDHVRRRLPPRMDAVAVATGCGRESGPLILDDDHRDDDDNTVPEYDSLLLVPGRDLDEVLERLCGPAPRSLRVIDRAVRRLNANAAANAATPSAVATTDDVALVSSPPLFPSAEDVIASLSHLPKRGYEIVLIMCDTTNSTTADVSGAAGALDDRDDGSRGDKIAAAPRGDDDGSDEEPYPHPFLFRWDVITSTTEGGRRTGGIGDREPSGPREELVFGLSMPPKKPSATVLELAHAALDLARRRAYDEEGGDGDGHDNENEDEEVPMTMDDIVRRAEERLLLAQGTDLSGRLAPDAAYAFALAGVTSPRLFDALATVSSRELRRVGRRASFGVRHVLHMVEKLAAAGYRGEGGDWCSASSSTGAAAQRAYNAAADCLEMKRMDDDDEEEEKRRLVESLRSGDFDLCSPSHRRSPLWLWRFSSKQKKRTEPRSSTMVADDVGEGGTRRFWEEQFDDPTRPLVVDIGCGMGVSLLGLATLRKRFDGTGDGIDGVGGGGQSGCCHGNGRDDGPLGDVDWSTCNFLGADVNGLFVGYANGIASRWGASDRLRFWTVRSEEAMRRILDRRCPYPGEVALVMVQFPTPFRFGWTEEAVHCYRGKDRDDGEREGDPDDSIPAPSFCGSARSRVGNSQLPGGPSGGFMVSTKLLRLIGKVLEKCHGKLLLQSNCEDVAVSMMNAAVQLAGFEFLHVPEPVEDISGGGIPRKRQADWMGVGGERACGPEWSRTPLIPPRGVTETEISCHLGGVHMHRCVLKPR